MQKTCPLLAGLGLASFGCAGAPAGMTTAGIATVRSSEAPPPAQVATPAGREVVLVDGDLDAWEVLGDALYRADGGEVLGEIGGGSQSFLVTREHFGDFELELDVRTELPGNSGIQVRSHVRPSGRLFGYQIEIDPSERAWSGGLYDEARRGWLDDLSQNPAGRAAYHHGEWNHYRIVCDGTWIRAWVNGVPTADYLDPLDVEGVIGLQVHSGNNTRVRWRALSLRDHGTRRWRRTHLGDWSFEGAWSLGAERVRVAASPIASTALAPEGDERSLRFSVSDPGRRLRVGLTHDPFHADADVSARPAQSEAWRPDGENRLAICSRAGRTAVHLNGRLLLDARDARLRLVVEPGARPVELSEAEWLGPPE